jgi:predicted pyridoxine 5'-phosphate oxidase superfamily flavin-nucleotide-binding protein
MRQLFTPTVSELQSRAGSRASYERAAARAGDADGLGPHERQFLQTADHFFLASVGESGWPYVQHRGGPPGFIHVLEPKRIGYAEFRGNQQFISVGNVAADPRASILVMDYAHQARLKLIGRLTFFAVNDAGPDLRNRLVHANYPGRVERIALFDVEGFDWNCPQHIVPRYTAEEIDMATAPLRQRIRALEDRLAQTSGDA